MTRVAPRTIPTRLKTIAGLLAVSIAILTGSPASAKQLARHEAPSHFCKQEMAPYDHRTIEICPPRVIEAPHLKGGHAMHDDWPANMILG